MWTKLGLQHGTQMAARCASINSSVCGNANDVQTFASQQAYGLPLSPSVFTASTQPWRAEAARRTAWQYMRDNWLSNRVFKSYEDIVDHCCYAWNTLVDRPWKIMSIGLRQWAHEF